MKNKDKSESVVNNTEEAQVTLSNLDVTAHTASLWKYIPIPETPEPFPEYTNSYFKNGSVEIISARVRGKKHKHEGTNCDDWYEFGMLDDCIFAAVSDGAGSKHFSRIGAKISCQTLIENIKNEYLNIFKEDNKIRDNLALPLDSTEFTETCSRLASVLQQGVITARNEVKKAFDERKDKVEYEIKPGKAPEYKDFSSTLLAAVIIPVNVEKSTEHLIITVQIGDGCISSINKKAEFSDALRLLGTADGGSFAGETDFLTSSSMGTEEELKKRTKIQRRKISTVMLMSDGVADDYYPNKPQMLRLYTDLLLNGIITLDGSVNTVTDANRKFISNVPEPLEYPWVNDGDVKYTLQYSNNVINNAGISLEELWKNTDVQRIASLESFGKKIDGDDSSEKLLTWLDNYVERGSFDDRTLIIINLGDK